MHDTLDKVARSAIMARVRSKDTAPEMRLRHALFARGFRYRLHNAKLPGKPDIVLPKYGAVIFVHGCLWHWHGCRRSRMPATNVDYWQTKITGNQARDSRNIAGLAALGWRVLIVWECALTPRLVNASALIAQDWVRGFYSSNLGYIEPVISPESTTPELQLFEISLAENG